jgi:dihydroorotate dehydrogenase (fumarate)
VLPLRCIVLLYGRIEADLALTGGVHSTHVIKAMMAGARVAMLTSELLANGIGRLTQMLADLQRWMEEHEYASIACMQGSMSQRANYRKALNLFDSRLP